MYTQSCRFALFTIRKQVKYIGNTLHAQFSWSCCKPLQFTCTVRTAVVFSPVRSYHVTSSPLIKNHSKDWKYRSKLWSVKGFNQTGFSPVLSRHIASNTTPLAASAAESINSLVVKILQNNHKIDSFSFFKFYFRISLLLLQYLKLVSLCQKLLSVIV